MAVGVRTWDSSGVLQMDTTTSMGRVLGYVNTGTSNGSITNAAFANGTPFWQVFPTLKIGGSNGAGSYYGNRIPAVSISGTTLSWTFSTTTGSAIVAGIIVYGVR